ncbi:MAG: ABC transporter ATP-binding protein, partial [Clostridia bacterium]|nr:ABC transporter ATP-binding protein [Clostridia bacterium]
MKEKKKSSYLSGREIRAIAKQNKKVMMALEAKKNRKAKEEEFLCEMKDPNNILEIDDLHTYFFTDQGVVKAVNGVTFEIPKNKTVGIVGESGCGKSVTSMSVMRLLQGPTGQIYSGSIRFAAEDATYDIAEMPISEIHRIRGKEIAMIFQEPMT